MQAIIRVLIGFRQHLAFLFLLLCAITIAISLIVGTVQFGWLEPKTAILFAAITLVGIILWWRQTGLALDIKSLKIHALDLREYESDIERRFEKIGQTLNIVLESLPDDDRDQIRPLVSKLNQLESRLSSLENSAQTSRETRPHAEIQQEVDDPVERPDTQVAETISSGNRSNQKIREEMLSLHLQAIVELPTRQPMFFDAVMRMKRDENSFLDEDNFKKVVNAGGLTPTIEKKVLLSSARMLLALKGKKKKTGLFCEVSASTLSDTKCFRELSKFLQSKPSLTDALVLQLSQRDFINLKPRQKERLESLADLGFKLALDRVKDLDLDMQLLVSWGILYLRIPAQILLHSEFASNRQSTSMQLIHSLTEHGITVISTGVDRETEAMALIDMNIKLASGYLFAPPRPVKPELLDDPLHKDQSA